MSIPLPGNIHHKFHPFIINHPSFKGPQDLKQKAAQFFADIRKDPSQLTWTDRAVRQLPEEVNLFLNWAGLAAPSTAQTPIGNKPFITTSPALPGYVIKQQRTDHLKDQIAPDALLYRVRKAEKIRQAFQTDVLPNSIKVPNKYLYYDYSIGKWYLLAEKQEDMQPTQNRLGNPAITRLAHLAFLAGLEDMHHENIRSDKQGNAIILDTEPLSRGAKKYLRAFPLSRLWLDMSSIQMFFSMQNLSILKQYTCKADQIDIVDRVANRYLDSYFVKTALKIGAHIAAFILVGTFLPTVPGLLGTKAAVTLIRLAIQTKGGLLALQAMPNLILFGLPRYVPKVEAAWKMTPGHSLVNALVGRVATGIGKLPPTAKIALAIIAWIAVSLYVPYTMLSFPLKSIAGMTGLIGLLQLGAQRVQRAG